ncbi:Pyruvate kinase [uncultured Comamonas sp.]|nr:Pyruvate kinase [uncultured Comamonas sp.]
MHRSRRAKIVATLGPASSSQDMIRTLFTAGVDVFRMNFSHGSHADHGERFAAVRAVEQEFTRPIGILADLQGPKLRVGRFADGPVFLEPGAAFRFDLDPALGDAQRVQLPHPEIFAALVPGAELLLDDGKLRVRVERCDAQSADVTVLVGGKLSERKGVNVPGVVLPISALTAKDRADLDVALDLGADWIALSFVQRPEDIHEARALIQGRAGILAKLEKPAAIDRLEEVVAAADAIMVARGDLGVELPAEQVPAIQKRIVKLCRKLGKPVIVATQMLESMIESPVPTRAEASDVATAIYDGADAVMLSAESAAGKYPVEAVTMMHRIIEGTEADAQYRQLLDASHTAADSAATADATAAICCAMRRAATLLRAQAICCFTTSGHTSLRAARERPSAPVLSLSPALPVARKLALAWGVHSVHAPNIVNAESLAPEACQVAREQGFAAPGDSIVILAGMPFGQSGTTNMLRIAVVE